MTLYEQMVPALSALLDKDGTLKHRFMERCCKRVKGNSRVP